MKVRAPPTGKSQTAPLSYQNESYTGGSAAGDSTSSPSHFLFVFSVINIPSEMCLINNKSTAEFKVHRFIRKIGLHHLTVQYKTIHLQTANTLSAQNI